MTERKSKATFSIEEFVSKSNDLDACGRELARETARLDKLKAQVEEKRKKIESIAKRQARLSMEVDSMIRSGVNYSLKANASSALRAALIAALRMEAAEGDAAGTSEDAAEGEETMEADVVSASAPAPAPAPVSVPEKTDSVVMTARPESVQIRDIALPEAPAAFARQD